MPKRKASASTNGQRRRRPGGGRRRPPANVNEQDAKKSTDAQKRAAFLKQYAEGKLTLAGAAEGVGTSASTIWRWRAADAEFDAQVKAVLADLDGLRVQLVEDGLFSRIENGKASAAEVIFFLCNRAPGRWRSVQRLEHTGAGGGPIRTADLSKLTPEELAKLEALLKKSGLELQA